MRVLIQRVKEASVTVDGKVESSIGNGLLLLLGVEEEDVKDDISWLSAKVAKMRVFSDEGGQLNLSIKDINGEVLVVSQFTLYASTKKGNRPSFLRSAKPPLAHDLYIDFIKALELELGAPVKKGVFGANMQVQLTNDGPVTIWVDTKSKE